MEFERIRNNMHRGYTMPHRELMDELELNNDALSEHLKSTIRLFEDKYDKYLNSDGYLDEKEESELLAESVKIKQDIEKWITKDDNKNNTTSVTVGVTLSILGLIGLAFGIKNLRR